ncbi:MAG: ABC transporter ATP-binding protein [Saprospiraceae bacterium]|nr:ABC transporter ATP-binding protein [Saprospiraceae bacterium]
MLLRATNIHKRFGRLEILKGVDLTVEKGEIVSIIGKSGAGKSTLLHILGTLDGADQGALEIAGTAVLQLNNRSLAEFRNRRIGFVFQFHHLLPEFTALENVSMPGYIAGRPDNEVQAQARELLDFLGLAERYQHKPAQLSGGEQQRVAVARALVNNPDIIFADEPTGNLDSQASRDLHRLIRRLCDELGQTFVIVTHNQELAELSDRRMTMADGLLR